MHTKKLQNNIMKKILIGFDDIIFNLINLYKSNNLPNKFLISGPDGIGKRILSKHLLNSILSINEEFSYNLEKLEINPENRSFKLLENSSHPNVFRIAKKEDKKNIEISQIREMIKFQNSTSFNNNMRFVLIEDSQFLNLNSINALLKCIEEPNNRLTYIITHNSNYKLLETLKSRCIEFKINLKHEYSELIVNNYFSNNLYKDISQDFKNYYNNPSFLISYINFTNNEDFDFSSLKIEDLLIKIFNNINLLKNNFIKNNLNLFIELFFYKNINVHKKNLFKAKEYFLNKLSNVNKYNLDKENYFLEFGQLLANE